MLITYNILYENVGLDLPMFFHQQLSSVTQGTQPLKKLFEAIFFLLDQLMLGISYQMK